MISEHRSVYESVTLPYTSNNHIENVIEIKIMYSLVIKTIN